mgnify:CR=1 FL=1
MSIRNRLTFRFCLIVGALLLVFSLSLYFISAQFLENDFRSRFKDRVNLTTGLLIKNGAVDASITNAIDKHTLNTFLDERILIIDDSANIHYHSFDGNHHPFNKEFLSDINKNGEAFISNEELAWFGKSIIIGNKKLSMVAESKRDYLQDLRELKILLIAGFSISLLVVYITGRYFAGRALHPVSVVIKEVDEISERNLNKRVHEGDGRDELSQLAQTFNRLLGRLEAAFQVQQNFVSNASHELRTPLSSITAQLEVTLMSKRSMEEYEKVMHSILEDIRDLNQLSEGLFDMTLASRDISMLKFSEVRIDELLLNTRSELLKRKTDYKINIHFGELPEDEKQLTVSGKEYLLKSSVRNIMDNACKFSADKTVNVFLQVNKTELQLRFTDNGIGMPQSYLDSIFTPLLRGENAKRIPGHGLGLALSRKIAELHRGRIQVISKVNEGTEVKLLLPTA